MLNSLFNKYFPFTFCKKILGLAQGRRKRTTALFPVLFIILVSKTPRKKEKSYGFQCFRLEITVVEALHLIMKRQRPRDSPTVMLVREKVK